MEKMAALMGLDIGVWGEGSNRFVQRIFLYAAQISYASSKSLSHPLVISPEPNRIFCSVSCQNPTAPATRFSALEPARVPQ